MPQVPAVRRLLTLLSLAFAAPAWGGLYSESERVPFPVGPDGVARELPYEPQFKDLLDRHLSAGDATRPSEVGGKLTPRGELLERLETARESELASQLVRGNFAERALNLLAPKARVRAPDFVALLTLAQAHASRGEWPEAARTHGAALLDAEPPAALPGATPEQTRWLLRVEKVYVARRLALHRRAAGLARDEIRGQGPPELFAGANFLQVGGTDAGRAALPADAVAVVQQLLLWSPGDTDLLWLLGELYAARGEWRAAEKVFDQCTAGRGYTDRAVLMEHRRLAREAAAALPPEAVDAIPEPAAPAAEPPPRTGGELLRDYWPVPAGLGGVGLVMVGLQVRSWRRRGGR